MTASAKARLRVRRDRPLRGSVSVPADLEILERSLLLAALGDGRSQLQTTAPEAALPIIGALRSLGVPVDVSLAPARIDVQGVGRGGLTMPRGALACERSWTSLALVSGLLAGQHFGTRITVHESLASRSVTQIIGPLRTRGAQIAARRHVAADGTETDAPPISVAPLLDDERLLGLRCELASADAAAKTAVLISGLFSSHETTISEPLVSPDHTERLFVALGLPLRRVGAVLQFDPSADTWNKRIAAQREASVPGCATCAAYLIAAALLVPGSHVALGNAGINPSRTGFLDALRLWGAPLQVLPRGEAAGREPVGDLIVRHGALRGGVLGGELLLRARGELAALALLAQNTQRGVQLFDLTAAAPALDPAARKLEALVAAFGLRTQWADGALQVSRADAVTAASIDAHDDPERAMAAVVLGLTAEGETVVEQGAEALALTHPGFIEALRELGADVELS